MAASLFGTGAGLETGPGLALYSTAGAPPRTYLDLSTATVQPLAYSPDSRYLAIYLQSTALRNIAARSSLVVLDTSTGALTTIAHGAISGASFAPDGSDRIAYGRSASLAGAPSDIYIANPDGSGVHAFTHDGHSLNPVWGSRYLAFDRERLRHDYAPVFQVWLGVTRPGGAPRTPDHEPAGEQTRLRPRADRLLGRRHAAAERVRGAGHERSLDGLAIHAPCAETDLAWTLGGGGGNLT